MRQSAEDRSFAFESFRRGPIEQRQVDKFDCDLPLEAAIAAFGEPNGAHTAPADHFQDAIVRNDLPGEGRGGKRARFRGKFARGDLQSRSFQKFFGPAV
jgi:hypothetical protein